LGFLALVPRIPCGAVARKLYTFSQRQDKPFLVILSSVEIDSVNKDITSISQVRNGGRKESLGCEDCIIIPALYSQKLQGTDWIKSSIFKVALEDWVACPPNLGEVA
jgi:hypothetical protein